MSPDLPRLQSLRLKGRATADTLAASWDVEAEAAQRELDRLLAAGLVEEKKAFYGLSADGEQQRVAELESERAGLDVALVAGLYEEFLAIDPDFKTLVTNVQLEEIARDDAPAALAALNDRFAPLARRVGEAIPRLAPYAARFRLAFEAFRSGDARYLASPLVDSYHTLWFELHQELIEAAGRTRAEEAAAGRG